MGRVLSARFSLELTTLFPFRQFFSLLLDRCPSTTSLVSSRTERLDLIGLDKPQHEILEQPEQHLPMDMRQGATGD